jgi:hypothetical protein
VIDRRGCPLPSPDTDTDLLTLVQSAKWAHSDNAFVLTTIAVTATEFRVYIGQRLEPQMCGDFMPDIANWEDLFRTLSSQPPAAANSNPAPAPSAIAVSTGVCPGVELAALGVYGKEPDLQEAEGIDPLSVPRTYRSVRCPILHSLGDVSSRSDNVCTHCTRMLKNVKQKVNRERKTPVLTRDELKQETAKLKAEAAVLQKEKRDLNSQLETCKVQCEADIKVWKDRTAQYQKEQQWSADQLAAHLADIQSHSEVTLAEELTEELVSVVHHISTQEKCVSMLKEALNEEKSGTTHNTHKHTTHTQHTHTTHTHTHTHTQHTGVLGEIYHTCLHNLLNRQADKTSQYRFKTSQHFLRLAFSIYLRSPKAARELHKSGYMIMPSTVSFAKYLKPFVPEFGFNLKSASQMVRHWWQYKSWIQQCAADEKEGGKGPDTTPDWHGILAFDEIKIRAGLCMNPKTNLTKGFCLNADDLNNFEDIYSHLRKGGAIPCQYVMVSMWRCADSKFELLGPIMASPKGLNHRAIHKYVWRCIEEFSEVGFQTDITVCDGASANLAFIRMNCTVDVDGQIRPWCYNRFSGRILIMIFDPPHGLKTKRNSLLSSYCNGTRLFSINDPLLQKWLERFLRERNLWDIFNQDKEPKSTPLATPAPVTAPLHTTAAAPASTTAAAPASTTAAAPAPTTAAAPAPTTTAGGSFPGRTFFGYQQIIDIFVAQEKMAKQGKARDARFLTREVVFPDQWTKMRVWMAKAWFCLTTVSHLANVVSVNDPTDPSLQALAVFCEAIQAIYVDGLMSRKTVDSMDHECITAIRNGLNFMLEWRDDWKTLPIASPSDKNKHFMAEVTFLEMLVTCIGVLKFAEQRFEEGKKVSLCRISQSRLEAVSGKFGATRVVGSPVTPF